MSDDNGRAALIRTMFDAAGRGLEIGAGYNPIVPKRAGFRAETVDHLPTAELRAKYAADPAVDATRIEEVDHVWDGRPLTDLIGTRDAYDYIVASHVIEHIPDMLGFLQACDLLLKPAGRLFLAVPDKRRCFDVFRPLASTGAVLQAHAERRRVHAPATAFDHVASLATLNGAGGWCAGAHGTPHLQHALDFAQAVFDRALVSTEYFDFHAWVFTPSSFRLILRDCHELGALPSREIEFRPTEGTEFYLTLGRSGAGCALDRATLLGQVQREMTEFPSPSGAGAPAAAPAWRTAARRWRRRFRMP